MKSCGPDLVMYSETGKKSVRRSWHVASGDDLGPLLEFLESHSFCGITASGVRPETAAEAEETRQADIARRKQVQSDMALIAHSCTERADAMEAEVKELRERAARATRMANA